MLSAAQGLCHAGVTRTPRAGAVWLHTHEDTTRTCFGCSLRYTWKGFQRSSSFLNVWPKLGSCNLALGACPRSPCVPLHYQRCFKVCLFSRATAGTLHLHSSFCSPSTSKMTGNYFIASWGFQHHRCLCGWPPGARGGDFSYGKRCEEPTGNGLGCWFEALLFYALINDRAALKSNILILPLWKNL